MKVILPAFLVFFSAVAVSAHFQLQFPVPRGPFTEDDEPTFCDGFTNATTNRTAFPLSGGVITLRSEHPTWSAAVFLSTVRNPNNFDNFTQVKDFFKLTGEGDFCVPLDLASSPNATGLTNGQNVSVQILFNGGDGNLFQCADLTLSNTASVSSVSCSNATGSNSTGSNSTTTTGSAALGTAALLDTGLLGLLGAAVLIPLML